MELVQLFKEQLVDLEDQVLVLETLVVEVVEQLRLVLMDKELQILVDQEEQEHLMILMAHVQLMLVVEVEV